MCATNREEVVGSRDLESTKQSSKKPVPVISRFWLEMIGPIIRVTSTRYWGWSLQWWPEMNPSWPGKGQENHPIPMLNQNLMIKITQWRFQIIAVKMTEISWNSQAWTNAWCPISPWRSTWARLPMNPCQSTLFPRYPSQICHGKIRMSTYHAELRWKPNAEPFHAPQVFNSWSTDSWKKDFLKIPGRKHSLLDSDQALSSASNILRLRT